MFKEMKQTSFNGYAVLAGSIQTAMFCMPFGAAERPNLFALFPPLGELQHYILPLSAILVGVASVTPWFLASAKMAKRVAFLSVFMLFISFLLYFACLSFRVVAFKNVMTGTSYVFSVGATKSDLAIETFGTHCEKQDKLIRELASGCDEGMIMAVGPTQQTVNSLWTKPSLFKTHVELLMGYLFCLIFFNSFVGATAKVAQIEPTSH